MKTKRVIKLRARDRKKEGGIRRRKMKRTVTLVGYTYDDLGSGLCFFTISLKRSLMSGFVE